jgi:hypothetical protein
VITRSDLGKAFNPSQQRDKRGRWSRALARTAGRVAATANHLADAMHAAHGIPHAEQHAEFARHVVALGAAVGGLHRELQALPDEVRALHTETKHKIKQARAGLARARGVLRRWRHGQLSKFDPDDAELAQARRNVREFLRDGETARTYHVAKRDPLAPITIAKRVEPEENNTMTLDELEKLEAECDALLHKAKALGLDDDDDDDDDVMNASDDGEPDDDDAEPIARFKGKQKTGINKSDYELSMTPRQPVGPVPFDREHQFGPTRSLGVTPTTQEPVRTKFDSRVEFIMQRDGVSKSIAMQRARIEYPTDYETYQGINAGESTSAQAVRRGGYGSGSIGKGAPKTYEDLVASEMRKGCTAEIAKVRIANMYGSAAQFPRALGKRSDPQRITKALQGRIDEVVADTGLTRCEALRQLRKAGEVFW